MAFIRSILEYATTFGPQNLCHHSNFDILWFISYILASGKCNPIPKAPSSSFISYYRPISLMPILSKLFERLLAKRLSRLLEPSKLLPAGQSGFRKNFGTNHALLFLIHNVQSALDLSNESRVVSLDFSAAFDRVSHSALIYKLRTAVVAGSFLTF